MDILARLKTRLTDNGETPDEAVLTDCIESAKTAIMNRRFPFGNWPDEVETRYQDLQFRIAMDLYNKSGAEGEMSHSENGISRTFESSWISEQLLSEVTPYCGVIS
jgi:hypothetical protein